MPKKHKPTKFLNLKLLEKFLKDYKRMPYKSKSAIMAALLILMVIPLALIYPLNQSSKSPLDLAPIELTTPPATECFITGCADHLCLDAKLDVPVASCDTRPEFNCLSQAKCELQPSGRCGWTDTPEYLNCIKQIAK